MTEDITSVPPVPGAGETPVAPKRSRKKLVAILLSGALVVGGGVTAVAVSSAYAAETERLCTVALDAGADALAQGEAATQRAQVALESVKQVELPEGAGTSTDYAARAGAEAIPAVKAAQAEGDKPAVEAKPAVPARPSAQELIKQVADERDALVKTAVPDTCADREVAQGITESAAEVSAQAEQLETSTSVLLDDFEIFQKEEAARIAAEKEAARIAAEQEAARIAAEAAAAEAAAQQAWSESYGGESEYSSGYSDYSGGGGGGAAPTGSGGQTGGGRVGPIGTHGIPMCSTGNGGVAPC